MTATDITPGLTENDYNRLLDLLDRLICDLEDEGTPKAVDQAEELAEAFTLVQQVAAR
jgi:hypothetical protein